MLILSLPVQAQSTAGSWVAAMTRYSLASTIHAVAAPEMRLHWAATAMGALAVSRLDSWATSGEVRGKIMSQPQAFIGDKWGDPVAAIVALPSIFLADKILGHSSADTKNRLEFAVASLVSVGITTVVAKELFRRKRPNGIGHRSFPSGHTSIAFAVAEVVRQLYGNLASAPFYLLAVNTGLSRIHDNKHYPSDIVAGAGLGIGIIRGFSMVDRAALPFSVSVNMGRTGIVARLSWPVTSLHRAKL